MSDIKLIDAEPEGGAIWPDTLNIRDTGIIPDDGGGRIYTTVGFGYKKINYVRGDLVANLKRQLSEAQAEIERMRPVVEAAITFDRIDNQSCTYKDWCAARAAIAITVRDYEAKERP
jgi:hypothetical protein